MQSEIMLNFQIHVKINVIRAKVNIFIIFLLYLFYKRPNDEVLHFRSF